MRLLSTRRRRRRVLALALCGAVLAGNLVWIRRLAARTCLATRFRLDASGRREDAEGLMDSGIASDTSLPPAVRVFAERELARETERELRDYRRWRVRPDPGGGSWDRYAEDSAEKVVALGGLRADEIAVGDRAFAQFFVELGVPEPGRLDQCEAWWPSRFGALEPRPGATGFFPFPAGYGAARSARKTPVLTQIRERAPVQ